MNELVIMRDQQAVTTSLKVAEVFEKNHRDVTRSIDGLKKMCAILRRWFQKEMSQTVTAATAAFTT